LASIYSKRASRNKDLLTPRLCHHLAIHYAMCFRLCNKFHHFFIFVAANYVALTLRDRQEEEMRGPLRDLSFVAMV